MRVIFFIFLLAATSISAQTIEHYEGHGCDCYIYPGGNDTTKTFTPTHAQIDTVESAIMQKMAMKHPPNNMRDLIVLGIDNFSRHYHGTISEKGHKELRVHGVNKSNPNEVWVTYYDLTTGKLYNFIFYGAGG